MKDHAGILEDVHTQVQLRTNNAPPHAAFFKFFNKIISCGRREGSGVGAAASLVCGWGGWALLGAGGLCGPWGQRLGSKARSCEGEGERLRAVLSSPATLPTGHIRLLPRLGDGGASSFGLRLRTGERCSRRGRSKRHRKASSLSVSHPSPHLQCMQECTLLPSASLSPATSTLAEVAFWEVEPGKGLDLLLVAFWLISAALTALVAPSIDQNHSGSPGAHPPPAPALKHTQRCLPHQQGPGAGPHAQTLLVALPRKASASAGHLEEARVSGFAPNITPTPALKSHLHVPRGASSQQGLCQSSAQGWDGGMECLLTFIPRAQTRVLWKAQDVWGRSGSAEVWARTR